MIKREKLSKPSILQINEENWKNELMNYIRQGIPITKCPIRYHNPEIKEILKLETAGKCIYCESKLLHVSFGHIEHIKPKSRFPEDTYDWNNLTLVCEICNNNKRDNYNVTVPPINPYIDDPSEYLICLGPMIESRELGGKGSYTRDLVKLNRPDLFERRRETLKKFRIMVEAYKHINDTDPIKESILRDINGETTQDKEFSFMLKEYLRITNSFE